MLRTFRCCQRLPPVQQRWRAAIHKTVDYETSSTAQSCSRSMEQFSVPALHRSQLLY